MPAASIQARSAWLLTICMPTLAIVAHGWRFSSRFFSAAVLQMLQRRSVAHGHHMTVLTLKRTSYKFSQGVWPQSPGIIHILGRLIQMTPNGMKTRGTAAWTFAGDRSRDIVSQSCLLWRNDIPHSLTDARSSGELIPIALTSLTWTPPPKVISPD